MYLMSSSKRSYRSRLQENFPSLILYLTIPQVTEHNVNKNTLLQDYDEFIFTPHNFRTSRFYVLDLLFFTGAKIIICWRRFHYFLS